MTTEREVMVVGELVGASIGHKAGVVADAHVAGRYEVECVGPREADRAAYIEVRDKMLCVELEMAAYGRHQRHHAGFKSLRSIHAKLKTQLAAFPLELKWKDTIQNVVTTVGKNNMLDNHLAGSAYTAAWFMGLISNVSYTTGPAAGDTMATHGGWTESSNYAAATRPAPSFSAASGGSKATSANVSFSINATDTIKGCFLNSVSTKGGTTGTLFSAGLFTGGDQPVVNGNTLNVSYTATLT